MDSPVFTFHFHQKLLPGFLAAAKYDGIHSSLTAVTSSDKVLIYQPKSKIPFQKGKYYPSFDEDEMTTVNVNQSVTSISAGCLGHNDVNDILLIGTSSFLHAYDVHNNVDVFYKEVEDGINAITIGKFGGTKDAIALIGGNCCIQGFDRIGNEVFWNVVGDRVSSMALVDFDRDGQNELVVGSTDYEITAFKNEKIVSEVTETDVITSLVSLDGVTFAYALSNGTIGLYDQLQRCWRVKSKNQAVSILGYDIDGDGVDELITGWSNGKVDARNSRTGDIVFTENMKHGVAGLAKIDLVQRGRCDLVSCSENGEGSYKTPNKNGYKFGNSISEGIFDGEAYVIHPKDCELSNEVKVPLFPPRDVPVDFHLKALVGYPESTQFHVFELTRQIPRFSMYQVENVKYRNISSFVSFNIRERSERLMIWMAQNFILPSALSTNVTEFCFSLKSLRTSKEAIFSRSSNGNVELRGTEVSFAGDFIQSLALFLNLDDLQVTSNFPSELEKLETLLSAVENHKDVKGHLEMDLANSSNVIQKCLDYADSSLGIGDFTSLRKIYLNLKKSTDGVIQTHKIYCERQENLKVMLTELNHIIQKASRLRVGESKAKLIQLCHKALEENNFHSLSKIITTGMA